MRNGITFTGNSDQGYFGQKYTYDGSGAIMDSTDMVAQWSSDGPGNVGPDRFRHIFTSGRSGAATGSRSEEGLEAMRMTPVDSTQVNVGIGDFYRASVVSGTPQEPTERLDILKHRVNDHRSI